MVADGDVLGEDGVRAGLLATRHPHQSGRATTPAWGVHLMLVHVGQIDQRVGLRR